jgi:hypothetical protein
MDHGIEGILDSPEAVKEILEGLVDPSMGEEITVDGIEKELDEQGISVNFNLIKN